jgi:hypothetical protein
VNQLFSDYGLLTIDGNEKELKIRLKIFSEKNYYPINFSKPLKSKTISRGELPQSQVNPREINLFYLTETRNRIEKINDDYFILDTDLKFSRRNSQRIGKSSRKIQSQCSSSSGLSGNDYAESGLCWRKRRDYVLDRAQRLFRIHQSSFPNFDSEKLDVVSGRKNDQKN